MTHALTHAMTLLSRERSTVSLDRKRRLLVSLTVHVLIGRFFGMESAVAAVAFGSRSPMSLIVHVVAGRLL